jgi:hypothetical protein
MAQHLSQRWIAPDQILVGLPASELRGRAWSISHQRPRADRAIEEQELTALLDRGLRLAYNRLQGVGPEEPESEDGDWLLLDATVVRLAVDDRRVTDPVGFRGHEVSATVFAALAPKEVAQVWGQVARGLDFSSLTLAAVPLALASGLAHAEGLLVDVGASSTDVTWCKAGQPVAVESIPTGGDALTSALLNRWTLSAERAGRLKHAYAAGKLADDVNAPILDALSPVLSGWLEEVHKTLEALNVDEPLPEELYLLGGGSALPEMADALKALAWSERLRFARYPQVSRVKPTDVLGVVNRTELGREPGDVPALALAAWAAQQSRAQDRPHRLLEELVGPPQ